MSAISKDGMDSWLDAAYTNPIKPLYLLIKVDVDKDIVRTNTDANFYCENHCNRLEYALVDWYFPDDEQYPYIAK